MHLVLLGVYLGVGSLRYYAALEVLDSQFRAKRWEQHIGAAFVALLWPLSLGTAAITWAADRYNDRRR